jgi:hypothetical protein
MGFFYRSSSSCLYPPHSIKESALAAILAHGMMATATAATSSSVEQKIV